MTDSVISVEKVLNSRCSSDFDGDLKKRHWGTYVDKRPSKGETERIVPCLRVPQRFGGQLLHWFKEKYLFLAFEKVEDPLKERMSHVESGMQHQAVYLACAALGLGTCIHNMGMDGTPCDNKVITARHLILEMTDCYDSGKYSVESPGPETAFKPGRNLAEPKRGGDVECLLELEKLSYSRRGRLSAKDEDISQLLWAAKGRTPHYIGGCPWGLTIPTWGHGQEYTDVFLIQERRLYQYINWSMASHPMNRELNRALRFGYWKISGKVRPYVLGNPTHDTLFRGEVKAGSLLDGADNALILSRNERYNRALWEIGYMLENIFLQSRSLGISYETKIFSPDETSCLAGQGIRGAVAAVLL